ncbi:endonuclease/exonuclease/phosphatase family protein [Maritalea mediterranea]|uniref:Endonuclease/exonuclease/phosphatase family protein n=1 Tax=Maritalea mediterranea TaxID=2909667 RepID=A0ABS9E7L6_9HYPH|nr:endonuclease/exonuclease/phosphatase family protein [Maritalea mediterranea]MCF4098169.1 endonuclease/exonuclease/phosphatase family protein [Maritalea mediterranea]
MRKALVSFVTFGFAATAGFFAIAAIVGFLGFALWPFDVFNHLQPIWLIGCIICLLLAPLFLSRQPVRGFVIALSATGFLAATAIVLPEYLAGLRQEAPQIEQDKSLRLMTFNIFAKNDDLNALALSVLEVDPDIVVFQEYWRWHREGLEERLSDTFPYTLHCQGGRRSFVALYAKMPFAPQPGNYCLDSLTANQRTSIISVRFPDTENMPGFSVITTHLDWPIPADRQRAQMERLIQAIQNTDGPILVAGDFNSTPYSYALKNLIARTDLIRIAKGLPTWPAPPTYPIPMPAWLQLDQMMRRGDIVASPAQRGPNGGSDHYPLYTDFIVKPAE